MVSFRDETLLPTCAGPGCTDLVAQPATGRPGRYCSPACRARAHRQRQRDRDVPVVVEVDHGSASSRGRPPELAWMVRLRRGERDVIVAVGLGRRAADRLAEQITELLAGHPGDRSRRPREGPGAPVLEGAEPGGCGPR